MSVTPQSQPTRPRSERVFVGARDLRLPAYREFLISRHGLERNEIVGRYIFNRRAFDTLEQALSAAHELELAMGHPGD